uniref:Basic leucine zipper transcriptional factor ATF-like protein n=1 Tax=Callorhinchus milii TaxID=7868 RepID=V9LIN8_CALMI
MDSQMANYSFHPESSESSESSEKNDHEFGTIHKKTRRREKNRLAAQKTRQKQTQRADILHQEHEQLEKKNVSLRREIEQLKDVLKQWKELVQEHEPRCQMMNAPKSQSELVNVFPCEWSSLEILATY